MKSRMNSVLVVVLAILAVLAGTTGVAQAASYLVSDWQFDEAAGASTAVDSVSAYNGAVDTNPTTKVTTGLAGKIGKAYQFPGLIPGGGATPNGTVVVPSQAALTGFASMTAQAWVNAPSWHPIGYGLFTHQNVNQDWCLLGTGGTNLTAFFGSNVPNKYFQVTYTGLNSTNVPLNTWHLFTLTYTNSSGTYGVAGTYTGTIYIDGVSVKTASSTTKPEVAQLCALIIGGFNVSGTGYNVFNGLMDDMAVWGTASGLGAALPLEDIKACYNTPGVVGLDTTGAYNAKAMDGLFGLYAAGKLGGTGTQTVYPGQTWKYESSPTLFNQTPGQAWVSGGQYFIQLGASDGVDTVIPEPGTLALLAAGLIGLLCYAWRKRR